MFKKFRLFFLLVVLISFVPFAFCQETGLGEAVSGEALDLGEPSTGASRESDIILNPGNTAGVEEPQSPGGGGVWLFLRMFFVLLFVIALIYFFVWFLKKTSRTPDSKDSYIRHTAAITIGSGKSVHIITVGEEGFILGASENSLSLISKLEDKDLIQAMNLAHDEQASTKKSFTDILSSYISGVAKKDSKSTENLASLTDKLKSTRSRFNNSDGSNENKS